MSVRKPRLNTARSDQSVREVDETSLVFAARPLMLAITFPPRKNSEPWLFDPQGPFTHDCRPDQMTPLILEVVDPAVEQETVVPDDQRVLLPFHAALVVMVLSQALQIV